jgi:type IV pilus assembly protein PilN
MIRINLLKPGKKEIKGPQAAAEPEFKEKRPSSTLYGLIYLLLIVAVGALYWTQRNAIAHEEDLLAQAQAEKESLQYVETKLQELEQQKELLQRKINLINRLRSRQGSAVLIMDHLCWNIPDWLWLTKTTYSNFNLRLTGKAISNNLIADYISNLERSPYFTNVDLISSTLRRDQNNEYLEFSLTAQYILPDLSDTEGVESQEEAEQ